MAKTQLLSIHPQKSLLNSSPRQALQIQPTTKPSWASLLKENRGIGNGSNLKHVEVVRTNKLVFKQQQVLSVECAWGICLIGFILGKFPGMEAFNEIRSSWQIPNQYMFHESGWIVFRFESENDRDKVLANGPYATYGIPWMLKKMTCDFNFNEKSFHTIPTWVKLPNLPLILWGEEALSIIGSFIGVPIQMDHFTSKRNKADFARILVEVDTTQPLLRELDILLPSGRELKQPIIYEVEPILCSKCHRLGHKQEECKGIKKISKARSRSKPRRPPFIPDVVLNNHQTIARKENAMVHREIPQPKPDVQEEIVAAPNDLNASVPIVQEEEMVLETEFQEVKKKKGKKKVHDDMMVDELLPPPEAKKNDKGKKKLDPSSTKCDQASLPDSSSSFGPLLQKKFADIFRRDNKDHLDTSLSSFSSFCKDMASDDELEALSRGRSKKRGKKNGRGRRSQPFP